MKVFKDLKGNHHPNYYHSRPWITTLLILKLSRIMSQAIRQLERSYSSIQEAQPLQDMLLSLLHQLKSHLQLQATLEAASSNCLIQKTPCWPALSDFAIVTEYRIEQETAISHRQFAQTRLL